ncbi:hypothetical protein T492DRAFT_838597 [Pavlovales sp. CCMP2436]|nr:hypothetical protein T492DRAFT_838597 [Pavlovales sp. CCMP2436]
MSSRTALSLVRCVLVLAGAATASGACNPSTECGLDYACNGGGASYAVPVGQYSPAGDCQAYACTKLPVACHANESFFQDGSGGLIVDSNIAWRTSGGGADRCSWACAPAGHILYDNYPNPDNYPNKGCQTCALASQGFWSPALDNDEYQCNAVTGDGESLDYSVAGNTSPDCPTECYSYSGTYSSGSKRRQARREADAKCEEVVVERGGTDAILDKLQSDTLQSSYASTASATGSVDDKGGSRTSGESVEDGGYPSPNASPTLQRIRTVANSSQTDAQGLTAYAKFSKPFPPLNFADLARPFADAVETAWSLTDVNGVAASASSTVDTKHGEGSALSTTQLSTTQLSTTQLSTTQISATQLSTTQLSSWLSVETGETVAPVAHDIPNRAYSRFYALRRFSFRYAIPYTDDGSTPKSSARSTRWPWGSASQREPITQHVSASQAVTTDATVPFSDPEDDADVRC